MISYKPFWETLKTKQVSQYKLLQAGIDNRTLDRLKKNQNITLETMEKLCLILDCSSNDVVEFIKNKTIDV